MRPSLASIGAKPPTPAGQGSSARGSRVGSIYRSVLDAVVEHRLPPGAKLTEEQLGAIFGASRTTVRSALQALAHGHIVTLAPHRSAFVSAPTMETARGGDRRGAIRLSGAFHIAVAATRGEGFLTTFLRSLISQSSLVIGRYG